MVNHKAILGRIGLFLLFCFFVSLPSFADTQIVNKERWAVDGAIDTGPNSRDIAIFVEGEFVGNFSELKIFHEIEGLGFPQIFSVKGNGALRPVLPPPGEFGATFYATGYWDCDMGLIQNMPILELDIRAESPENLRLKGKASNLSSFEAPNFTLRFFLPTTESVRVKVTYKLVATRDFCIDQTRQTQHGGFRIARMASNFLSLETHDSDQARYINTDNMIMCANLQNEDGLIFLDPLPMGRSRFSLIHTNASPRNTPTLRIKFLKPRSKRITPQGFVAASSDPNDDNIDLWGNWDKAKAEYAAGDTIGRFMYILEAIPPGPLPCG